MSLLVPQQSETTTIRRRRRVVQPAPSARRQLPATIPSALAEDGASVRTDRIFQALLGIAACLALTGVIIQSQAEAISPGSPEAPAPAVFVQVD